MRAGFSHKAGEGETRLQFLLQEDARAFRLRAPCVMMDGFILLTNKANEEQLSCNMISTPNASS